MERPAIRAAITAFALLLNAILPGALAVSVASTNPLGSNNVICFAGGVGAPSNPIDGFPISPDDITHHCPLCLLRHVAVISLPQPARVPVPAGYAVTVRYDRAPLSWQRAGIMPAFDARAPPA